MGNEINVTSSTSVPKRRKDFTLTKKDSSGQTYTMTATIFDRNYTSNHSVNQDALPSKLVIDQYDAIQFGGKDLAQFTSKDIASIQCQLFDGYEENSEYETSRAADIGVDDQRIWSGNNVTGLKLDSGKSAMNLGQFKAALEKLSPANCSQGNQAGGSRPAAEGGNAPQYAPQFGSVTMPDMRGLESIMQESGYRAMMLSPDGSALPYIMGADTDAALKNVFDNFFGNVRGLMGGSAPYTPSGSTSGSDSGSTPADDAAAKKAKDAEDAKKAKEAAEAKKIKEAIAEAKKQREEEVAGILKAIFDATHGAGTDEKALNEAVAKINKENVLEVLETWEKSPYAEKMDKSLIETIHNDTDGFLWLGATEKEYLKPIAEALRARSNSKEANLRAGLINSDFDSDDVEKLYKLVQKESTDKESPLADPLVVRIEERIKAENKEKAEEAKLKAKEKADEAKANADVQKAEQAADQAKIDAALADAKAKAGKKGLNKKAEDKVIADAKATLAAEKAEKARLVIAEQKETIANQKAQNEEKEAAKKIEKDKAKAADEAAKAAKVPASEKEKKIAEFRELGKRLESDESLKRDQEKYYAANKRYEELKKELMKLNVNIAEINKTPSTPAPEQKTAEEPKKTGEDTPKEPVKKPWYKKIFSSDDSLNAVDAVVG